MTDIKTPEFHLTEQEVELCEFEYSSRHPADWVVSGPMGPYGRNVPRGRHFYSWEDAEAWAKEKYGARLVGRPAGIPEESRRWAFVIRGDR